MTGSRRNFLKNSLGLFTGAIGGLFLSKNVAQAGNTAGGKLFDAIENGNTAGLWPVEAMELNIAENLIPLVDKGQGGDLIERIGDVRRRVALDLGILLPPVRIRDDFRLSKNDYVFRIRDADVGSSKVYPDCLLALKAATDHGLDGILVEDPVYKMPCVWISWRDCEKAEAAGYDVVDANSVIITHLCEIVKQHAADLLMLQHTSKILDEMKETAPALVSRVNGEFRVDEIHKILRMLLRESVSIRDMTTILETLVGKVAHRRDPLYLAESVRTALACQITEVLQNKSGHISAVRLDAPLEDLLRRHVIWEYDEARFDLPAGNLDAVIRSIRKFLESGRVPPPVVTAPTLRPAVWRHLSPAVRHVNIISTDEITPGTRIITSGVICLPQRL